MSSGFMGLADKPVERAMLDRKADRAKLKTLGA